MDIHDITCNLPGIFEHRQQNNSRTIEKNIYRLYPASLHVLFNMGKHQNAFISKEAVATPFPSSSLNQRQQWIIIANFLALRRSNQPRRWIFLEMWKLSWNERVGTYWFNGPSPKPKQRITSWRSMPISVSRLARFCIWYIESWHGRLTRRNRSQI